KPSVRAGGILAHPGVQNDLARPYPRDCCTRRYSGKLGRLSGRSLPVLPGLRSPAGAPVTLTTPTVLFPRSSCPNTWCHGSSERTMGATAEGTRAGSPSQRPLSLHPGCPLLRLAPPCAAGNGLGPEHRPKRSRNINYSYMIGYLS